MRFGDELLLHFVAGLLALAVLVLAVVLILNSTG